MSTLRMISPQAKISRVPRSPSHNFTVRARPFNIQPIMIAPVFPGDTLKRLMFQNRAVTQPLKNRVTGWWLEHYFYYVKLSQLDDAESFVGKEGMLMNPTFDPSTLADAADPACYHEDTAGINYVRRCLNVVTRHYFRDEGETEASQIDPTTGLPLCYSRQAGWRDSIAPQSIAELDAPDLPDDAASATMAEVERLREQWEFLQMNNVVQMEYDDYLALYGVKRPDADAGRPEELRYTRTWQDPSSAVDGATGATSTVISWKVAERADKDRFFKEHGFIFGCAIARPKTFNASQRTAAVTMYDDWKAWRPPFLQHELGLSLKNMVNGRGPLSATTGSVPYTVDTNDLAVYGDDFVYLGNAATIGGPDGTANLVGYPNSNLTEKTVAEASVEALFADTSDPESLVEMSGIVDLTILGTVRDTSPQNMGRVVVGG